ncbi:GNAT family N-acetyltransferase [Brachybacterium saurashtrense]|uniref:N-acetyltransferase n=1 Tax=Brachybacterium saurashtrense TaxID=556288 RepID=A0A345YLI4_9MICO|nr:GNAT family N-acetyltransferase [Brachybacterium saurashtrense]AXK44786.1 N-acetyltransferase [Brachybacterium saurashtrense]RRR23398.1 N-acetyltransferase [Brachybacterium saurashtrense]
MDETSAGPGAVRLVHDDDRDRYEALDGDEVVAVLAHGDEDLPAPDGESLGLRVRDLRSTVVAPDRSGIGIGSAIVRFALEDIRAQGMRVRPTCWFVRGWIERHPEYADLLESPFPQGEGSEGRA